MNRPAVQSRVIFGSNVSKKTARDIALEKKEATQGVSKSEACRRQGHVFAIQAQLISTSSEGPDNDIAVEHRTPGKEDDELLRNFVHEP